MILAHGWNPKAKKYCHGKRLGLISLGCQMYYGQVNLQRLRSSVASKWASKHLYFAGDGTLKFNLRLVKMPHNGIIQIFNI